MLGDLQMFWRFAVGLRRFLAEPLTPEAAARLLLESLERREQSFLWLLRRAVFENRHSPYLPLLRAAGVCFGDLERSVQDRGIEATLASLRDAGVTISLDQFKGRSAISCGGTTWEFPAEAFDNPLLLREFTLLTGGSSGRRKRLNVDLDLLVFEAATQRLFLEAHGLGQRPLGLWRPVPPGSSGIKHALRSAKNAAPVARWFDLTGGAPGPWQSRLFLQTALRLGRRAGKAPLLPEPEPVSPLAPEPVLRWLASCADSGTPALLSCPASAAVRIAQASCEQHIPIDGTVFWVGGEPLTPGKAAAIAAAHATTVNGWSLSETGPLAVGCAARAHPDEVHLLHSKVALIPALRPSGLPEEPTPVLLTSLHPALPKMLLNVDIGDSVVLTPRSCGCPVEAAGFPRHAHTIRAVGKVTAGGMHLPHADLACLVEEVLPHTFGGSPVDYQFVERESAGEPVVALHVSPRLAGLQSDVVLRTVAQFLSTQSRGHAMMVDQWLQADTLRVVREQPFVSPVGKTPSLWICREE
jgi:hypothetical protein